MIYFTADLHFGHKNILAYSKRPWWERLGWEEQVDRHGKLRRYPTISEQEVINMNEGLVERWNKVVTPDDTVWVLGDVAMGDKFKAIPYVKRLNGHRHLVVGNHDMDGKSPGKLHPAIDKMGFESIQTSKVIEAPEVDPILGGTYCCDGLIGEEGNKWSRIFLHHQPIFDQTQWLSADFHIFGHVHEKCVKIGPKMVNCGVDVWDWTPVTLGQILADPRGIDTDVLMAKQEYIDSERHYPSKP